MALGNIASVASDYFSDHQWHHGMNYRWRARNWGISSYVTETCMCTWLLSSVQLFVASSTVVNQAPLSTVFSRQEYWSGLSFPSPGGLPHPGTEPSSFTSPTLAGGFFTTSTTWDASKVMFKIFQSRIQQYVNWELPDVQGSLEKVVEPEIKLPTSFGS